MRKSDTSSLCQRHAGGQSLTETVVGIIFIVPVALFLLDVAVVVLANTANDTLAKSAARAAAGAVDSNTGLGTCYSAQQAANAIVRRQSTSPIIPQAGIAGGFWVPGGTGSTGSISPFPGSPPTPAPAAAMVQPGPGQISVVTYMVVQPPVPFPGLIGRNTLFAKDIEPIVSLPP